MPVVTSSASVSVCTSTSEVPYTTQWVETQSVCTTATAGGNYGSQGWGAGGWGAKASKKGGW